MQTQTHEIIIYLQIEITLSSKLEKLKCIDQSIFSLWCTVFVGLRLHTYNIKNDSRKLQSKIKGK